MFESVESVVFPVRRLKDACEWYADLLATRITVITEDYPVVRVGSVKICFHEADDSVSPGPQGPLTYWAVADLPSAVARAESKGARLVSGPVRAEAAHFTAILEDPFGNHFGVAGPHAAPPSPSPASGLPAD